MLIQNLLIPPFLLCYKKAIMSDSYNIKGDRRKFYVKVNKIFGTAYQRLKVLSL